MHPGKKSELYRNYFYFVVSYDFFEDKKYKQDDQEYWPLFHAECS